MTQGKRILSNIVPVLIAAIVCDVAVTDPSTGKNNLIGVFDRVHVGTFPTSRQVSLYMRITDAEGYYRTEVRYVQVGSGKVIAKADAELQSKDKLQSMNVIIHFPPLPIPQEGRYEFQIWANDIFLGSTYIDTIKMKQKT
ncbi:MAG: hypothetical protein ABR954_00095 [Dehalococcoidales bacterium]